MKALRLLAGPTALRIIRERGLQPGDIRVIPAAAGGPKGLILGPLDKFLFGHWLPQSNQVVHLLGASIGAWRMAAACLSDPVQALERLSRDYIKQTYPTEPGGFPTPQVVSEVFAQGLAAHFGGREHEVLSHPRYRLHVFTSHGRHVLAREGRWRTAAGYLAAFAANAVSRRALSFWLDRVVFSDPRDALPLPLNDFRSHNPRLTCENLQAAVLASCSIPFWLRAVQDIPGGPRGAYWDGGITDYHLHLRYDGLGRDAADTGLALYPHFQRAVVPGWLDKPLRGRWKATPALDRLVLLAPSGAWVSSLPGGKLPDRSDFKTYAGDLPGRMARWRRAVAESQRLADEFQEMLAQGAERHVAALSG